MRRANGWCVEKRMSNNAVAAYEAGEFRSMTVHKIRAVFAEEACEFLTSEELADCKKRLTTELINYSVKPELESSRHHLADGNRRRYGRCCVKEAAFYSWDLFPSFSSKESVFGWLECHEKQLKRKKDSDLAEQLEAERKAKELAALEEKHKDDQYYYFTCVTGDVWCGSKGGYWSKTDYYTVDVELLTGYHVVEDVAENNRQFYRKNDVVSNSKAKTIKITPELYNKMFLNARTSSVENFFEGFNRWLSLCDGKYDELADEFKIYIIARDYDVEEYNLHINNFDRLKYIFQMFSGECEEKFYGYELWPAYNCDDLVERVAKKYKKALNVDEFIQLHYITGRWKCRKNYQSPCAMLAKYFEPDLTTKSSEGESLPVWLAKNKHSETLAELLKRYKICDEDIAVLKKSRSIKIRGLVNDNQLSSNP